MLKRNYSLLQKQCCISSCSFEVHQAVPEQRSEVQQQTQMSLGHYLGEVGQLKDPQYSYLCNSLSCRPINEIKLNLYGQSLSLATRKPQGCCYAPSWFCCYDNQLIVTTNHNVLIGKVQLADHSIFRFGTRDFLNIYNADQTKIYIIRSNCCQLGNFLPGFLRIFAGQVGYQIYDPKKDEIVGQIFNTPNSCCLECFCFSKNWRLNFPKDANDKAKILLMNALMYINVLKYQCC